MGTNRKDEYDYAWRWTRRRLSPRRIVKCQWCFENRFDVILTNPPFGSRVEKSLEITEADVETDVQKIAAYEKKYGKEVYQQAREPDQ